MFIYVATDKESNRILLISNQIKKIVKSFYNSHGSKFDSHSSKKWASTSFSYSVTMRTIRTMNTIAGFSLAGMLKICVALNKERQLLHSGIE